MTTITEKRLMVLKQIEEQAEVAKNCGMLETGKAKDAISMAFDHMVKLQTLFVKALGNAEAKIAHLEEQIGATGGEHGE